MESTGGLAGGCFGRCRGITALPFLSLSCSSSFKREAISWARMREEKDTIYPGYFFTCSGPPYPCRTEMRDKLSGYHGKKNSRGTASARTTVFVIDTKRYPGWAILLYDMCSCCWCFFKRENEWLCSCYERFFLLVFDAADWTGLILLVYFILKFCILVKELCIPVRIGELRLCL